MDLLPAGLVLAAPVSSISHSEVGKQEKAEREGRERAAGMKSVSTLRFTIPALECLGECLWKEGHSC